MKILKVALDKGKTVYRIALLPLRFRHSPNGYEYVTSLIALLPYFKLDTQCLSYSYLSYFSDAK
jgi:hypothetical protein